MEDNNISILLIEDDDVDIMHIERSFRKYPVQYHIHIAKSGLEALNMLRGDHGIQKPDPFPQIILLDINMPKMNGLEFLQDLRADNRIKHLSVYVMTSSQFDKDRVEAYHHNVAGYISKPLSSEKIDKIISALRDYWRLNTF